MSDIFLSYDHRDFDRVKVLVAALQTHGWTVFFDREIPAGKTWRQFIGKEIDECRCMVVVWSINSINSHWVCEEADIGLKRKILVPLILDQVMPPLGFGSIQAASLVGWQGKAGSSGYLALCKAVTEHIGSGLPSAFSADKVSHQSINEPKKPKIRWSKQLRRSTGSVTLVERCATTPG
jgi:formylglycine-generating enzyme